jgi:hypothetical protein
MLKKSKSLFMISQHLDEIFMQFVDLSQRFGGTCLDLVSPPNERLGDLDAEVP